MAAAVAISCSGTPRVAVLGGEEHGDALAEDLALGVAEELLGAGVPADDPALGIDGEDGEVLDALDHQPQVLLGLAQRLLDPLALGDLVLELPPPLLVRPGDDPRLGQLALGADLVEHAGDDRLEVVEEVGRLGDEVAHAGPQRLDQQALVLHAGHQDRRHVVAGGLDLAEELQAADARG